MPTSVEHWREGARTWHTHEPNDVTVQLDGLGRQLSELPVQPGVPEGSDGPVFVDESGRRSKTFRRLGWILAAVCAGYAVTLVVAVLGGNSSAPWLPLSGQEQHKKADDIQAPSPAPSGSADAVVPPGATPGATQSGQVAGGGGPTPSGSDGSAKASTPAKNPSASTAVVPPKGSASTGSGTQPDAGTPDPEPPAATPTPSADPGPTETPTTPVETPDPPVQEQEGAH